VSGLLSQCHEAVSLEGLRRCWVSRYHGLLDDRFLVYGVVFTTPRGGFHPSLYVRDVDGRETMNWRAPARTLNQAKRATMVWIRELHALGLRQLTEDPADDGEVEGEGEV
jgi:hypothetical protein